MPKNEKMSPEETLELRRRAILETALAYYRRGFPVQYDSVVLTIQEKYKGANIRECDYWSPEMATKDTTLYSVCSAFCFEVYYNALGYKILGDPLANKTEPMTQIPKRDPMVAERFDISGTKTLKEGMAACRAALQPGDLLVGFGKTGHVLLYLGDILGDGTEYLTHCWGRKYDMKLAEDFVEYRKKNTNGGAIRLDPVDEACFEEGGVWDLHKMNYISVLRPLNVATEEDYPLTPSALSRLKYPGMDIDRTASVTRTRDVAQGDEVSVCIRIRNCSKGDYEDLSVSETVPAGTTLVTAAADPAVEDGGKILRWSLNVPAGESRSVCYTVRVTAKRGETVTFGGGFVAEIPSNSIAVRVGGARLGAAADYRLLACGEGNFLPELTAVCGTGEKFGKAVYETVLNICPELPALSDILDLYTREVIVGAEEKMLVIRKDLPVNLATQTMIPYYWGGRYLWTEQSVDRTFSLLSDQLIAGDIILMVMDIYGEKKTDTLVYLGGDRFIMRSADGKTTVESGEILQKTFTYDYFCGLRPTLARDDLAKGN